MLSDVGGVQPSMALFGFGLSLSGWAIALECLVINDLIWSRIHVLSSAGRLSGTSGAMVRLGAVVQLCAAVALGACLSLLAVIPITWSDPYHVLATESYFVAVAINITVCNLLLAAVKPFPYETERDIFWYRWKYMSGLGMLAVGLFLILFHARVFWVELFDPPQLTYALVEGATVFMQLLWVSSFHYEFRGAFVAVRLDDTKTNVAYRELTTIAGPDEDEDDADAFGRSVVV